MKFRLLRQRMICLCRALRPSFSTTTTTTLCCTVWWWSVSVDLPNFAGVTFLLRNPFVQDRAPTSGETCLIEFSFCYYLYDSLSGWLNGYNSPSMLLHHALIFLAYYHLLRHKSMASEITFTLLIGELSNPFLILMKTTHFESLPHLSHIFGGLFVVSYLALRTRLPFLLTRRVCLGRASWEIKVSCSAISSLFLTFSES